MFVEGDYLFGGSVGACSPELNPAKIRENRADIHSSAASSSEVFPGLYRTNACPECFDSFWPSSVGCWEQGAGNDCSYSPTLDLPLCTSQTRLAVMQWCMVSDRQQGCLAHARPLRPPPGRPLTPTSTPQSDGSASARHAFITSQ